MALLTPTLVNYLTDKLVAAYIATLGTTGSGFGMGDGTFGSSLKALDLKTMVQGSAIGGFADADIQNQLVPAAVQLNSPSNAPVASRIFALVYAAFIRSIDSTAALARASVSSTILNLDTFLYWYNWLNAVTYNQCLCPPDWVPLYLACYRRVPTPKNVWFSVLQGGTYTNGLGKLIVGTGYTAGASINRDPGTSQQTPAYAGGAAQARVSSLTGSGVLTVTGHDQNGDVETWTATISANGVTALTPSRPRSLITNTSAISAAVGISVGTVYIECVNPTGRTYPPT